MTTEVKPWDNHHYCTPQIWVLLSGGFWDWWDMMEGQILLIQSSSGWIWRLTVQPHNDSNIMEVSEGQLVIVNVIEGPIQHPDLNKPNISCLSSNCLLTTIQYLRGSAQRSGNISSNQRWLEAAVIAKGTKCQVKGQHACCYTICQHFLIDF